MIPLAQMPALVASLMQFDRLAKADPYRLAAEIDPVALDLWLAEARVVQYDYKNIMRNRGRLDRLV
jgi:hypothetical protein